MANPPLNHISAETSWDSKDFLRRRGLCVSSLQNFMHKSIVKINREETGVYISKNRDYKYKLGIIDFLTKYTFTKKIESTTNHMIYWNDYKNVSC